jgi:hypothetical protein
VVLGYGSAAVGAVYQSAGTFSAGSIVVGADGSGTYSLSGGALQTTANQYVGGNYDSGSIGLGTFSHSVGTNTVGQYLFIGNSPGSTGVYSLISGTLHVDVGTAVGELGNAMFIQNGGRHEIIGPLWLGYGPLSSGTYTLNSPGALSSGDSEYIGASGAGTFFHNSGSNTCSVMRIGSGGSGRYLMTSGTLTVTEQIQLGAGSGNWFSHTGGTVDSGTLLFDGGLYTQSGGTLSVATINVNGDPSHYAFNAGTLIIDTLALSPTQALGGQLYLDAPRCVTVNKNLTLPAGSKVTIDGGTLSAGSITNAGADVRLLKGNLRLTGTPPLIVGSTGQFGAALEIPSGFRVDANTTSRVNLNSDGIILISGGTLNCLNGMDMYPGGQLYLDSPAATLSGGTLTLYGGTLSGTGRIASRLTNNGGTIRLESGDHLQFTNADNFTNGTVELLGGVAEFAGSVTNTGAIIGRGTVQAGTLHNINTITFSGGPSEIFGVLQNDLFSRVLVTGGSHSTFYRDVTNVSGSSFKVSQDSIAAFIGDVTGMAAFNGPGTKIFEAGATDGAIVTSGESIVETGGSLSISSIRENALTVRGSAAVLPNGTSTALSRLNVLAIESGSFDLNDNDLIADNTPIGTVKSYLASAYNNGSWNGNGLTSSVAREIAADPTNVHMTALGYAEASAIGVTGFDGQIVGGDSVLVRYTFYGDANLDRKVNALDFNALASNFGNGTGKIWTMGDFNYDGMSNTLDFNAIAINFNQALPSPALGSLIPEPAGCAIFAGAGAICLRRRRQTPA